MFFIFCFRAEVIRVYMGSVLFGSESKVKPIVTTDFTPHHSYERDTKKYDVALIRLPKEVKYTGMI